MTHRSWERDKDAICHAVAGRQLPFKIVLKTKNERLFLRRWVEHHLRIVGPEGLLVFDNGSDDPEVLAYLDEIAPTIAVYSFAAMHNTINYGTGPFADLYAALRASCDRYMFLDTDEYLYWANEDGSYADDAAITQALGRTDQPVIPGIWASNHPGEDRVLKFTFHGRRIPQGIRMGKPAVSSALTPVASMAHTCRLPEEALRHASIGNLVVAHLNALSVEQRILVNIEKQRSSNGRSRVHARAGLEPGPITRDTLMALDPERLSAGPARAYLRQMQDLVRKGNFGKSGTAPAVTFRDGEMTFMNQRERQEVLRFLRNPAPTIAAALAE